MHLSQSLFILNVVEYLSLPAASFLCLSHIRAPSMTAVYMINFQVLLWDEAGKELDRLKTRLTQLFDESLLKVRPC